MEQTVGSTTYFLRQHSPPLLEDPIMRLLTLIACFALSSTIGGVSAAERCFPGSGGGSVWIEGSWQQCGGQYSWRPGYWQTAQTTTTTTVYTTPSTTWEEGHWAQGANGSVWVEGHYEASPAVYNTGTTTVVYSTPPPQVIYEQPRPCPQTIVVVNGGYGHGHNGYYGGYQRPVCNTVAPRVTVGVAVPLPVPPLPRITIGHVNHIPFPVPVIRRR